MAKSYLDIQAQIENLQAEAKALRQREVKDVIGRIKEAIRHYGITMEDLGFKAARAPYGSRKTPPSAGPVQTAKYSDGQGNVWGGRGPRPAWLRAALAQGRTLEEFAGGASASEAAPTPARRKAPVKAARKAPKAAATPSATRKGRAGRRPKAATASRPPETDASPSDESASQ